MKTRLSSFSILFLALAAIAHGQEKTIQRVSPKPTVAIDGKSLFHEYCAVCHGADGKGAGPAAKALQLPPGDLTQISRKNEGKFPEDRILRVLKGEQPVTAHGSQDMPIWGKVFNNMSGSLSMGQTRIHALLQYVESLQAK
jgi:mono/diheme cytochrome c family protein